MRKYVILDILLLLFVFLSIPTIHAAEERGIGVLPILDKHGQQVGSYKGSYALLIGVSCYTSGWPNLESVPDDIENVETVLTKHGFFVRKIINPDNEELENAFESFINDYGYDKNNRLLFFFSGHGYSRKEGKKGYLVPSNAPIPHKDEKGFLRKSITMDEMLTLSRKIEAKHALFLFDSCFSGTIFKSKVLPEQPLHISLYSARPVRQFITAGSAGEKVPAKSVFTPSFVRALEGEADFNNDHYVTGTELGVYIYEKVLYYNTGQTPQYGKIKDPDLDEGDFVFALRDDIYESQLQLPSNSGVVQDFTFGNIEKVKKKRQEEEERLNKVKAEWSTWQNKLDFAYKEALQYDEDAYLGASEKVQVWKRIIDGFSQDNPYSTEDQMIRSRAVERLKYWKNYKEPEPVMYNLRTSYKKLSVKQVRSMPHIAIHKKKFWGFYGHSTINHDYEASTIHFGRVVRDHATGLMWHQSGSDRYVTWYEANKWLKELNQKGYAGFNDWRFPTLEEAASLFESDKHNGLYISPDFDKKQKWFWTGDEKDNTDGIWRVNFIKSFVSWCWARRSFKSYVRPVRTMK